MTTTTLSFTPIRHALLRCDAALLAAIVLFGLMIPCALLRAQNDSVRAADSTQRDTSASTSTSGQAAPTAQGATVAQPVAAASDTDAPQLVSVRATADPVRGVVAGGTLRLAISQRMLADTPFVRLRSSDDPTWPPLRLRVDGISDSAIVVAVPDSVPRGRYVVDVMTTVGGKSIPVPVSQPVRVGSLSMLVFIALVPLAIVALLVWFLVRTYKPAPGQPARNWIQLLLLDPRTNSYSLSRAQFIYWTVVLVFSYGFLFLAQGMLERIWMFPSLAGFGWTFLISLGTLLGAEATVKAKGSKGSGSVEPRVADLVLHGGVIALERVQQVLWTLVGSSMFVWMLVKNYAISTAIPDIPEELLYLMGLSSAGYITGKMIRNPGPVIQSAVTDASGHLSIDGSNLAPGAQLFVDGAPIGSAQVATPDPDKPTEMATRLGTRMPNAMRNAKRVMVMNPDGQRSEFMLTNAPASAAPTPVPPAANAASGASVAAGTDNAGGQGNPAGADAVNPPTAGG